MRKFHTIPRNAGAKLVYEHYKIKDPVLERMIHHIDLQDRHVFDDSNVKLARGLNSVIKNSNEKTYPEKFMAIYKRIASNLPEFDNIESHGGDFIEEINALSEQIIKDKRVIPISYNGKKGVYFSAKSGTKEPENRSMIITYIFEKLGCDFGIAVEFHGKEKGISCSVRSNRNYNILEEMKELEARGHPTAAGFSLNGYGELNKIFNSGPAV